MSSITLNRAIRKRLLARIGVSPVLLGASQDAESLSDGIIEVSARE
jgi:hypothetical protein